MSKILICDLGAQTKNRTRKKGHKPTRWRRECQDLLGPESLELPEIFGIDVMEVKFFYQLNSAVTSNCF